MTLEAIIHEIDIEIAKLEAAKQVLSGACEAKKGPGRPKALATFVPKRKRAMSPEGRARIAAAQRARWAAQKKKAAKAA